jgi:hypothetical protein
VTVNTILIVIVLLQIKHFVVDFLLQNKYQWSNKGTYGHPGGVLHSGLHGVGTYLCVSLFTRPDIALGLALIDWTIHYHIDWAKMQLNERLGLTPASPRFWVLLGLDQLLHQLTYVGILFLLVLYGTV